VLKIHNHINVYEIPFLCIWRKYGTLTGTDINADRGVNNKY